MEVHVKEDRGGGHPLPAAEEHWKKKGHGTRAKGPDIKAELPKNGSMDKFQGMV